MEWNREFKAKCIAIPEGTNTMKAVNTPELLFSAEEKSGVGARIRVPVQMSLRRLLIFGSSGPDVDPSVHHLLFPASACIAQPHKEVRVTESWQCILCVNVCDRRTFSFTMFSLSIIVSAPLHHLCEFHTLAIPTEHSRSISHPFPPCQI